MPKKDNEQVILEALQAQVGKGNFVPHGPRVIYDPTKHAVIESERQNEIRPLQAAGGVQVADISAVDIAILLQEVIGDEMPFFNLRGTCRIINMPELKQTVPLYTKMGASNEKVPELVEAEVRVGDFTNIVFALWKNVAHIVISDEAKKRANIDAFAYQKTDAAIALAHSEETQIAAELTSSDITSVSANGGWDVLGTYHSNYNPYLDIQAVETTLAMNGFTGPYDIVAHPQVWASFWANTFVKGFLTGVVNPDYEKTGGFSVPGLPGNMGWSSPWVVNTECYVLQRNRAIILGNGPTEAAAYRNEIAGYDAYLLRQWLQPLITHPQASRKITGVYT